MKDRIYTNRRYLDALAQRVLVFDGAMGTSLQTQKLTAEQFGGERYNGCNDYLVISYPQAVEKVHRSFLEVGVDVIETDTFRSNRLTLGEYGLGERVLEINRAAAQLARRLADEYSTPAAAALRGRLDRALRQAALGEDPELSNITFDELADVFREQATGLIEGGVDLLLIETSQDILEVKAAITGIHQAFAETGIYLPIQAQVTLDTTGRMLLGTDIAAVLTILEGLEIDVDRAELLHRPGAHARADPLPGRTRHPAGLLHPQRRAAAQRRRRGGLPAGAGAVCRGAGRIRGEIPRQRGRRLLRHHPGAPAACWWKGWATARSRTPSPRPPGGRAAPGLRHPGHPHAAGTAARC